MSRHDIIRGKQLTAWADIYGLKRRWFGLEPDFMLRRRVCAAILGKTKH